MELKHLFGNKASETEEIPEPGSEENPWIGYDTSKGFHALSGAERNRVRRAEMRRQARAMRKANRAHRREFIARQQLLSTRAGQLAVLEGKQGTEAQREVLNRAIERRIKDEMLSDNDRRVVRSRKARVRRIREVARRKARFEAGTTRGKDHRYTYDPKTGIVSERED